MGKSPRYASQVPPDFIKITEDKQATNGSSPYASSANPEAVYRRPPPFKHGLEIPKDSAIGNIF